MSVISVQNLSKLYRIPQRDPGLAGAVKALFRPRHMEKVAVDQISFEIKPGEIVGYIGVNGAGKSTTIKMLTGIMLPTAGQVRVLGRDPYHQRQANAREIGAVFGQRTQLWWDLALIESYDLIAKLYEIEPALYRQRLTKFVELLGLEELLKVPVRNLSLGQKMRAEMGAALLHQPKVAYLDEPTIGLDVMVKERIREFIREQNRQQGTTFMLTTHDLGDIEELCQRVIILDGGAILYDGPLATIRDRFGTYRTMTCETALQAGALTLPAGSEMVAWENHRVTLRFDKARLSASDVVSAVMTQVAVRDFTLAEPDLESIIKQIYGGAMRREVTA